MSAIQFNAISKEKSTNLIVDISATNWQTVLDKIDAVGPHVVAVMLHIDTVNFNDRTAFNNFVANLLELKEKHNILVIEDRKYADKPAIVSAQLDRFDVYMWADVVTAHGICGAEPIRAISARHLHVLLIHTMCIPGNIVAKNLAYQDLVFNMGDHLSEQGLLITGFISQEMVRVSFDANGKTKSHLTFAYYAGEPPKADYCIYEMRANDITIGDVLKRS